MGCQLGHGRGQTQLLGCLSACACTSNAFPSLDSAEREELMKEVEEAMAEVGQDYGDDGTDDELMDLLGEDDGRYGSEEPEEIEEIEAEEPEELVEEALDDAGEALDDADPEPEPEGGKLPDGVPDIPGLHMEGGQLMYKGEKVTSITGMDGEDEGEKVYGDEAEGEDEEEVAFGDEELDEVEEVQPLESLSEVKKITPIKSLSEIKSILPIKSINEISSIDEVKEIIPIPEDIARNFIKKHNLKHGAGYGESEMVDPVQNDLPQPGTAGGDESIEVEEPIVDPEPPMDPEELVTTLRSILEKMQEGIDLAMEALEGFAGGDVVEEPPLPPDEVGGGDEAELQGGSVSGNAVANSGGGSGEDEIESIEPLKSVKPIKSIKEVKSMMEVKKMYELTDEQAEILKEMQKEHEAGGYEAGGARRKRRRRRRRRI